MKTIRPSVIIVAAFSWATTHAATFTVTSTNDDVNAGDGVTSLREAILAANANSGDVFGSLINFNLGPGPHVITPSSPLPMINGSIYFTTVSGNNNIILNGSAPGLNANGLRIGSFVFLGGFTITGFSGAGILVDTNQTGSYIGGCVIAGNGGPGIDMKGNRNQIVGNTIATNVGGGIVVRGAFIRNSISQNKIFDNTGLGIDLLTTAGATGASTNDNCDADSGGNGLQNWPQLTSATSDGVTTTITGTINSTASRFFFIEFFANDACSPLGSIEGKTYLGGTNAITDASCNTNFTAILPVGFANPTFITATAQDGNFQDTSEFSPCIQLTIGSPPTANNDIYTTDQDMPVNDAVPGVLVNDTDPDNDPLTAVQVTGAMHGTGTISANGALSYTPASGFSGVDVLTYRANDGVNNSANATVVIGTGADTPAGSGVTVQFLVDLFGVAPISGTFTQVTVPGTTFVIPIDPSLAGTLPSNYTIFNNVVVDITTTASVTPPIDVCFTLTGNITSNEFAMLRLLHNEGGTLVDRTTTSDFATKTICAQVTSLSPFALALFDAPPPEPHDLAVTTLKAPKKVTLKTGVQPKPGKLQVTIQNLSDHTETINDLPTLQALVDLTIESLGVCAVPVATLTPPKSFPVTVKPNGKLKLTYSVAIICANDPLANSKTDTGHEDYRFTATVDHAALDSNADTTPANDICPRPPNPATGDKGCGAKDKVTKQLGADVLTDVVIK